MDRSDTMPWDLQRAPMQEASDYTPEYAGPAMGGTNWVTPSGRYFAEPRAAATWTAIEQRRAEDDGRRAEQFVRRVAEQAATTGQPIRGQLDLFARACRRARRPLSREERRRLAAAVESVWPELARTAPAAQRRSA